MREVPLYGRGANRLEEVHVLAWRDRSVIVAPVRSRGMSTRTSRPPDHFFFFFFITLGLELSDTKVYEP